MYIKLGNQLSLVEQIFDETKDVALRFGNAVIRYYTPANGVTPNLLVADLLGEYIDRYTDHDGWFALERSDDNPWHVDGTSNEPVVIISYPEPLEVLEFAEGTPSGLVTPSDKPPANLIEQRHVNRWLKTQQAKIVRPAVGDIAYLPGGTIHRGSPKTVGSSHLVLRVFNPTLKEHYKRLVSAK